LWTGAIDYALPPELIAQQPAERRDEARLMVVDRGRAEIEHRGIRDMPDLLRAGDLVIANDSKVFPGRLQAHKASGGAVEILLLSAAGTRAEAIAKSSKPLRAGARLAFGDGIEAEVSEVRGGGRCVLDFGARTARDVVDAIGHVPLPPYIRGGQEGPGDRERYQTVYAREPGSVAAPTAGLHFTPELLARIQDRGARFRTLTLHVGPGTFVPVRGEIDAHAMESEGATVTAELAAEVGAVRGRAGRLLAVGTTTVRALETAADPQNPGLVRSFAGKTSLFIKPGHRFAVCDALLTNFHLPHSSLLCLVMAFAGEELIRYAYEEAVRRRYRFYSYGDAMLIV
jgi:S-adenosylmethionine:tRNA ribosyltransferase-isomerase